MFNIIWISTLQNNSFGEVTQKYYNVIKKFSNWNVIHLDVGDQYILQKIITEQPDFVIILWNDKDIKEFSENIYKIRDKWNGKFVPFVPIDFENPILELIDYKCDFYLSLNDWGTGILKNLINDKEIFTLEHIVSGFTEYSLSKRKELKQQFWSDKFKDYFIIGCVNANSSRKRLDTTIKTFNLFYEYNNKSLLVIKTTKPDYNSVVCNYLDFSKFTPYHDNIIIITDYLTSESLNDLYNSFDLMINTTDGEGFGLIPFEASLAGTLTILPHHTSFKSLIPEEMEFIVKDYTKVPYQYARNSDDIFEISEGKIIRYIAKSNCSNDRCLSFMNEEPQYVKFIISKINNYNIDGNVYSDIEELAKDVNSIIKLGNKFNFQIGVTSDVESLRYVTSIINNFPNYLDNILYMEKSSLNSYIGEDTPHVSIVEPIHMFNKLKFFYENQKEISIVNNKFQKWIEKFSEKNIFDKLQKIFESKHS